MNEDEWEAMKDVSTRLWGVVFGLWALVVGTCLIVLALAK